MMGETNGSEQTSIEIRVADQQLASTIQTKLCPTSPFPAGQCCIFEVPVSLRESNKKAYVPNIISIGPHHNAKENLKPMEQVKSWYMCCLLERKPTLDTNLDCFVKNIRKMEPYCRECYAKKFDLINSDKFVEMMIVDGCFIIELFRKLRRVQRSEDDIAWMSFTLKYDLLLLENQLPWGVLECLWNLTVTEFERYTCTLPGLAVDFFSGVMPMIHEPKRMFRNKHLLDLLRNILLSSAAPVTVHTETMAMEAWNWEPIPCVTELLQAGVKFKVGNKKDLLDIKFNKGVMEIPPILIQENAEYLFRNLVAFEQCDRSCTCTDKIASYAILLDNLINSTKDVDFLCQEGIIKTYFSHEDLASIFFRLCSCTVIMDFSYVELSQKVNAYYKARWPRWQAILRRDYFNNPWSILSFFAAILILFFTFAQTLFSVLSYQDSLARP